ncbi:MAG: hypothetical protein RL624_397 [Bacteroidota bacterium]|jgi:4-amino-4-deoxy-L-arabinose transferase-like glycosyltransferase
MQLIKKYLFPILFTLSLLLFTVYQSKYIPTAYFWDELGVYIPAAQHMNDAGTISLLPSSLDPLYSRGHPLLYTFLNASVFHFFGDRVAVAHTLALIISLLVLVSFYFIISNLLSKKVAFFSCLLLAVQPLFISMALLSLPEMCLCFFLLWAVWALVKNYGLLFALMSTLAILTKESAIVIIGVAVCTHYFDKLFLSKNKDKNTTRFSLIYIIIPVLVYALFLAIQRIQNGWFFFPEHIGYLHFNLVGFFDTNWLMCKQFFFHKSNFIVGIASFVYLVFNLFHYKRAAKFHFVVIAFIIVSMFFSNVNFYMQRYLLIILPWIIVLGVWALDQILDLYIKTKYLKNSMLVLLMTFSTYLAISNWDSNTFNDTCDISYRRTVSLVQETANWLQSQTWKNEAIEANFPVFQALQDPRNGYVKQPFAIDVDFQQPCKYGIFFKTKGIWDPLSEHTYEKTLKLFKNDFAEIRVVQFF